MLVRAGSPCLEYFSLFHICLEINAIRPSISNPKFYSIVTLEAMQLPHSRTTSICTSLCCDAIGRIGHRGNSMQS